MLCHAGDERVRLPASCRCRVRANEDGELVVSPAAHLIQEVPNRTERIVATGDAVCDLGESQAAPSEWTRSRL
jgi:hypothetical protein